jgi:hypothetical protein
MVAASAIGVFFIPVLYVIFQWLRERIKGLAGIKPVAVAPASHEGSHAG